MQEQQGKGSVELDIAAEDILLGKGTAWIKVLRGALRVIAPEPGAGAEKAPKNARAESREPVSMVSQS